MDKSNYMKKSNNDENIILHDGTKVVRLFYEFILYHIEKKIASLQPGLKYTVKKIFGKENWNLLEKKECLLAGKCVAHMVAQGVLPLEFAGRTRENSLQYQLK